MVVYGHKFLPYVFMVLVGVAQKFPRLALIRPQIYSIRDHELINHFPKAISLNVMILIMTISVCKFWEDTNVLGPSGALIF